MRTGKLAVISGAVVFGVSTVAIHATENPFELKVLGQGYQVADADSKTKEGKCSSGKCGAKMKDGSCSADKIKEGSCHHDKSKEGSCSADKMKEGTCHASK